ncbi:hypothetical protein SCLCIDRAFT_34701 [Scleroderma citrinum Foug A]|uniref:Uncharacterized protein n=1 Tax=Scleroderma citrinum Foug A TaxID=1036808 RepID=A0A0C3D0Z5_9AGAM|nr:hypothetical protein SCLCIDRAFT_34701 [Scleroderma citrinum Foug A]
MSPICALQQAYTSQWKLAMLDTPLTQHSHPLPPLNSIFILFVCLFVCFSPFSPLSGSLRLTRLKGGICNFATGIQPRPLPTHPSVSSANHLNFSAESRAYRDTRDRMPALPSFSSHTHTWPG